MGNNLMQIVPLSFDDANPRGINRLEQQLDLSPFPLPGLVFPTLLNDVVVEDQGNCFGASLDSSG